MRASQILNSEPRTVMITMLRTPDREKQYKWIGPLGDGAIYFYKKKGSALVVESIDDAKNARSVACRNAGLVRNVLREKGFKNLDATAASGESIYRKLMTDRCDLAVSDAPLGVKHLLKQWRLPLDTIVQTPVKIVESRMYIACSKDIPDAEIDLWQHALDKLKATGVYDAIGRRYVE
ncbi:MAG: ABC transporter substrate-binding protein [Fibrobacterota bacterium]